VLSEAEDPTKAVSVVFFRLHTAWKAVEIVSRHGGKQNRLLVQAVL
jgi:hypothetical protein